MITIVPRYILINKLPYPIRVSQFNANENIVLEPGQRSWYNFKNAKKQTDKKLTIGDFLEDGDSPMSAPFLVEDLDDFQLPYKSVAAGANTGGEPSWFEPSEANNMMKCVRVVVTTQDDASLFVYFQNPEMPEYSINNATTDYVIVRLKRSSE